MIALPLRGDPTCLIMQLTPPWRMIGEMRVFLEGYCEWGGGANHGRAQQVGLAAHELLQNAIAYSVDGVVELRLKLDRSRREVSIVLTSRSSPVELESLKAQLALMQLEANPMKNYLRAMKATLAQPEGRGGLGLARIWSEAQLSVSAEFDGNVVRMCAAGELTSDDAVGAP